MPEELLPYEIGKWETVKVYYKDLARPHDKFCICICPKRGWFFFVNSDPPFGRKAREVALEIGNFEASFIHKTSYIDTTRLEVIDMDDRVVKALSERDRCLGAISPSLKKKIIARARAHGALPPAMLEVLLDGEDLGE